MSLRGMTASTATPGARTRGVQIRSLHNADRLRHGRKAGVPRFFAALALTAAALSLAPAPAEAQYFGRNKVQYEQFDWQIFDTPHFNVYHYPADLSPRSTWPGLPSGGTSASLESCSSPSRSGR